MIILPATKDVPVQLKATAGDVNLDIVGYGGMGVVAYAEKTKCDKCSGFGRVVDLTAVTRRQVLVRCPDCIGTGRAT